MQEQVDKLAAAYIKIRDARSQLKKDFEAEDSELRKKLETIEAEFNKVFQALEGASNIKTRAGTIIRSQKTDYFVPDWSAMHGFILEHADEGALELMQRRLAPKAVAEFVQDHPDAEVPVSESKSYKITVRRASN
jgi:hypothetical protein